MHVVDHEPHHWFLLDDDGLLHLDVHCNHGPVGYSVLVALDDTETRDLCEQGRDYLHRLADAIQDSAPLARGSRSPYRERDLTATHRQRVSDAVEAWRAVRPRYEH
ncbi:MULTISPECIES: hypothetical protein [Pseudonocardia]|uniref:Uncharacterized protein n=2 Tax=Pseudonocardia TaxID=1847 RepID=A0A1Y2MKP0_PSEAH|nr:MULTISPECIES: hypothetical protein [Pseudonocardia]OSY35611.1 hypothetical protein BG845_05946 [Pseudonocardia autotrophica]TDN76902.1 hypothetical protein C8E95_6122 [Pseudonocardia autotrophica]BBG00905.1 hypothetical protein Pdca_21140 [Pseudonocardia autotrophica]GEC27536.1 hypothetical protein PSA01_45650 [Pseudonocardia saturnea]